MIGLLGQGLFAFKKTTFKATNTLILETFSMFLDWNCLLVQIYHLKLTSFGRNLHKKPTTKNNWKNNGDRIWFELTLQCLVSTKWLSIHYKSFSIWCRISNVCLTMFLTLSIVGLKKHKVSFQRQFCCRQLNCLCFYFRLKSNQVWLSWVSGKQATNAQKLNKNDLLKVKRRKI